MDLQRSKVAAVDRTRSDVECFGGLISTLQFVHWVCVSFFSFLMNAPVVQQCRLNHAARSLPVLFLVITIIIQLGLFLTI